MTNFCDPRDWAQGRLHQEVLPLLSSCRKQERVYLALGCHPHFADRLSGAGLLQLERPARKLGNRLVAIGECGLDNSRKNAVDLEVQKRAFGAQVQLALKLNLPLVLHIRGWEEEGRQLLKELKVPANYRIHRHCFTESWPVAASWLKLFPASKLGITGLVTFPHASSVHEVARRLPLHHLLLETDAPYFLPSGVSKAAYGHRFSQPGHVLHVAAQVAVLRGVGVGEVLLANRKNIQEVYRIDSGC